jgi:superfamily II DNA/RNA helicase
MTFEELGLSPEVLSAVQDAGYQTPTPIQAQAVPYVLMGRDVLGCAQTGTGKTASFTLPMIDILHSGRARARMPRSLILEPTRELATQVAENFEKYGKNHPLSMALLIGGVSLVEQEKRLDRGVDVLIATPGRLLDLFGRGRILLADTKILVIDESDRMLDMGFMPDVERIVGLLPRSRQTLFFSATMPREIRRLADKFLSDPKEISVSPPATAAETVSQAVVSAPSLPKDKRAVLRELVRLDEVTSALIFCNRKRDVGILYRSLARHGLPAAELHGDLAQPVREQTLKRFKDGEVKLLVCSDVAARGLDLPKVSHVFNFDVPGNPEDYIHRIGRTGRAGRSGQAYMLITREDRKALAAIHTMLGHPIEKRAHGENAAVQDAPSPAPEKDAARHTHTRVPRTRDAKARDGAAPNGKARRSRRRGQAEATGEKSPPQTESSPQTKRPARSDPPKLPPKSPQPKPAATAFGDHVPAFLLRQAPVPPAA